MGGIPVDVSGLSDISYFKNAICLWMNYVKIKENEETANGKQEEIKTGAFPRSWGWWASELMPQSSQSVWRTHPSPFSQLLRPVSLNNLFSLEEPILVLSPHLFEYILSFFPKLSSHQPTTFFTLSIPENWKQVLWLWQKRWIHCEF